MIKDGGGIDDKTWANIVARIYKEWYNINSQ